VNNLDQWYPASSGILRSLVKLEEEQAGDSHEREQENKHKSVFETGNRTPLSQQKPAKLFYRDLDFLCGFANPLTDD
jgi:hypothetical protein